MSETRQDDPWAKVQRYCVQDRIGGRWPVMYVRPSGGWLHVSEVDAARAAEAAQRQQEIAAKDETIDGLRLVALGWEKQRDEARARLAAVEAERDAFKAENGEVRRLAVKERADLAAFADRAEAERDRHARHIDRAWAMLANCYDIESREECERSPLTHDGFLPLEMAIHAIFKRDPKVSELTAERDRLKAALEMVKREAESAQGSDRGFWLNHPTVHMAVCAALSGEGTKP